MKAVPGEPSLAVPKAYTSGHVPRDPNASTIDSRVGPAVLGVGRSLGKVAGRVVRSGTLIEKMRRGFRGRSFHALAAMTLAQAVVHLIQNGIADNRAEAEQMYDIALQGPPAPNPGVNRPISPAQLRQRIGG